MSRERGDLPERGAVELLESLYARRATGELTLLSDERRERLYLLAGELYLPSDDADAHLAGGDGGEGDLAPLVERLAAWGEGEYQLREGAAEVGSDARGPLPTAALIMAVATAGLDDFQLLRRLGGEEALYLAPAIRESTEKPPQLDPTEAFLLSRLDRPASVDSLLQQSERPRREVLLRLCRLLAVGLIAPAGSVPDEPEAAVATPEVLRTFESRIAESLEHEPLELEADEHREQLRTLIQRLGEMNHFQLLGVDITSGPDEIHASYLELARRVHPGHAARIGLAGREAAMSLLFERATEAYLTLNDSERTRKYLAQLGDGIGDLTRRPSAEVRSEERRDLAERNYRMARTMADREEYHFAIELLHQAVRTEPRAEYYALLGDCQARNPNWQTKAIFSYQRAVELAPDEPGLRVALARAFEQVGNRGRARAEYRAALERDPSHHGALQGMERLQAGGGTYARRPGWLKRFVRWLRG